MGRHDRTPAPLRLTGLALLALLPLACGPGAGTSGDPPSPPGAAGADVDRADPAEGEPSDTVRVILDEYVIELPGTLPPGRVVFHVVNEGLEDHNFLVDRADTRAGIAGAIPPGDSEHLTLELEEGEYTVLCTWAGHDSRGMIERVEVAAPGAPDDG